MKNHKNSHVETQGHFFLKPKIKIDSRRTSHRSDLTQWSYHTNLRKNMLTFNIQKTFYITKTLRPKKEKSQKIQEKNRKERTSGLSYCVVPLGAPSWSSGPFPPGFSWAPPVFYSDYTFQQIGWWRVASNVDAIVGQEIDDSAFITI